MKMSESSDLRLHWTCAISKGSPLNWPRLLRFTVRLKYIFKKKKKNLTSKGESQRNLLNCEGKEVEKKCVILHSCTYNKIQKRVGGQSHEYSGAHLRWPFA